MARWWGASFTGHKALGSVLGTPEGKEGRWGRGKEEEKFTLFLRTTDKKRHKITENHVC